MASRRSLRPHPFVPSTGAAPMSRKMNHFEFEKIEFKVPSYLSRDPRKLKGRPLSFALEAAKSD